MRRGGLEGETLVKGPRPNRKGDPPSPRQLDFLIYIGDQILATGIPPTLREIGAAFGFTSTNGIARQLRALEVKGYIERTPLASRAMNLTPEGWAYRSGDTGPDRWWAASSPATPRQFSTCGYPVVTGSGRYFPGSDVETRYVDAVGPRCSAQEAV